MNFRKFFTKQYWIPRTKGDWICMGLTIGLIAGYLFGLFTGYKLALM